MQKPQGPFLWLLSFILSGGAVAKVNDTDVPEAVVMAPSQVRVGSAGD